MKKSEMYKEIAKAIVLAEYIATNDKVEILKEVFEQEELALFRESQEAVEG